MLTSSNLALIFPRQEVFKQVAQELQRNILESEGRAVEQLEQVQVVLQVSQGRDLVVSEGRVTSVDDALEVVRWYLGARDVQRQDVVGEVGEGQVFPVLPVCGGGDLLGDVQATVVGEALEDDVFEGELPSKNSQSGPTGKLRGIAWSGERENRTSLSSPRVLRYRWEAVWVPLEAGLVASPSDMMPAKMRISYITLLKIGSRSGRL